MSGWVLRVFPYESGSKDGVVDCLDWRDPNRPEYTHSDFKPETSNEEFSLERTSLLSRLRSQ